MGGAGGHMRHPHDLNEVESGKDVIALFRAIPAYLKSKEFKAGQSSSLKLDGSNNGLRLAYRDGKYQFVIDRGTKMDLDIQGVSVDQLEDRFVGKTVVDPETGEETKRPHGMVASSLLLLNMMNEPLVERRDEMFEALKELGFLVEKDNRLIPDPTKYISIEYVERTTFDHPTDPNLGRANVIYYPYDFIAFHGVSEFFEMILKKTGAVVRQGPQPGPEDSGPGKPIPYNRAALDRLVEIVTPYAPEGFKVFAPISLKVAAAAGEDITDEGDEAAVNEAIKQLSANIEQALNTNISIRTSSTLPPTTKTLEGWLADPAFKNFNYKPDIKIKQIVNDEVRIRKVSPFHKDIHVALIKDQKSVSELVVDTEIGTDECDLSGKMYDCEKAVYGAIFLEAARILGNTVKESLIPMVEEFGPAVSHEGIVIDAGMPFGKKKTGHAFKITGEFIVDARGGAYAPSAEAAPALREEEEEFEIVDQDESNPPMAKVGLKTIAVVPGAFKPPHQGHADMVRKYASMADEVIVLISKPLKKGRYLPNGKEITSTDSLKIWNLLIGDLPNVSVEIASHASPLTAAYEYIGEDGPLEPGTKVILGCSEKGCDWKRWTGAEKYVKEGVELVSPRESAVEPTMRASGEPYSATDFRELLGDAQNNVVELEDFIGKGNVPALLDILGLGVEEPLEEMSAMGGGAVGGYSGPLASTSVERTPTKKKRKKKKNENIDMSLVNEVFELLIERGNIL